MNKKQYKTPTCQTVELNNQHVLAGESMTVDNTKTVTSNDQVFSDENGTVWEDE